MKLIFIHGSGANGNVWLLQKKRFPDADAPDLPGHPAGRVCASVDEYLVKKKQKFMEQMETCQREGRLFFAREVTDEVLEFIRNEPEMGGGARVGNIVYETKIPFLTKKYLAETDPTLKRYYYCHCPWARAAVKSGEKVAPIFCNCSAGFHKNPGKARSAKKSR